MSDYRKSLYKTPNELGKKDDLYSPYMIRKAMHNGELSYNKVGQTQRIAVSEFERWKQSQKHNRKRD